MISTRVIRPTIFNFPLFLLLLLIYRTHSFDLFPRKLRILLVHHHWLVLKHLLTLGLLVTVEDFFLDILSYHLTDLQLLYFLQFFIDVETTIGEQDRRP